jgi:hypothetical protein
LGKPRNWVYIAPSVHLFCCAVSYIGLVKPSLGRIGILFTFVLLADLPISIPAYALAWKVGGLALAWVIVVGTLWWYAVSRFVDGRIAPKGSKNLKLFG